MERSNAKGEELEQHFAEWMKRKLRYTQVVFRHQVKGRVADRPYEVDIKARKFDARWEAARLLGVALVVLAALSAYLPELRGVRYAIEQAVGSLVPSLASSGLFVLGVVAFIIGIKGRDRSVTHTWVECKNTKAPVKREHVMKLAAYIEDVEADRDAKWRPDRVFFVAGEAGFDQDALNFTREHGFVAYQRDGEEYKEVA